LTPSFKYSRASIAGMTMLSCSCKDVYDQDAKSKTVKEYDDGEETVFFEKHQTVKGDCSCTVNGKKVSFEGISLDIESTDEHYQSIENFEKALEGFRATVPSLAFAAPHILPRL